MMFSAAKLWECFGITGALSIVVWVAALVMLVGFARHRRRTAVYWRAAGVALVGLLLAILNSHHINQIRYDSVGNVGKYPSSPMYAATNGGVTPEVSGPCTW